MRQALTLMEVLLSISLFAALSGVVYGWLHGGQRHMIQKSQKMEQITAAVRIVEIMRRDILASVHETQAHVDKGKLKCVTVHHVIGDRGRGIHTVTYGCTEGGQIFRRSGDNSARICAVGLEGATFRQTVRGIFFEVPGVLTRQVSWP